MDLFEYWRVQERYAKYSYFGKELITLIPLIHKFDFIQFPNGMYEITISGIVTYLIKNESGATLGTYKDYDKEIIDDFIRRKNARK